MSDEENSVPTDDEVHVAQPVARGEIRTVEDWATAKAMLPMYEELPEMVIKGAQAGASVPLSLARSGIRAPRVNHEYHKFLAAKVGNRWPEGQEMTEAEFDKAIADAMAVTCR